MGRASKLERYMLQLINQERAKAGLDPLRFDSALNTSAERHSEWILQRDVFSHTGIGGSQPTERMKAAGYKLVGDWRTGENLAIQSERGNDSLMDDVRDLHNSLMRSATHRANILNPKFDEIGIGIERGMFKYPGGPNLDSVTVTQNFAKTGAGNNVQRSANADSFDFAPRKAAPSAAEPEEFGIAPGRATFSLASFLDRDADLGDAPWVFAPDSPDTFLF